MADISKDDVARIAKTLGASKVVTDKESYRLKLSADTDSSLTLVIYPKVLLGRKRGALITAYAAGAHLQLHNCSGFVISEELEEVTFVTEKDGQLSGLVVGRDGFCSQYASVNRDLISSDFTRLGVEVMLSGVALSLAEGIVEPDQSADSG